MIINCPMSVCIHVYTSTRLNVDCMYNVCINMYIHAHICTYIYVDVRTCTVYLCVTIRLSPQLTFPSALVAYIHVWLYCMYVYMYVHVHVIMHVCIYTCTSKWNSTFIHSCTCTHICIHVDIHVQAEGIPLIVWTTCTCTYMYMYVCVLYLDSLYLQLTFSSALVAAGGVIEVTRRVAMGEVCMCRRWECVVILTVYLIYILFLFLWLWRIVTWVLNA